MQQQQQPRRLTTTRLGGGKQLTSRVLQDAIDHSQAMAAARGLELMGTERMSNFELDQLIAQVVEAAVECGGKPITMIIPAGRTQTRHLQKRFYSRLKHLAPDNHLNLRGRVHFVSAKDAVQARRQPVARPAPVGGAGHAKKVAPAAPAPAPKPSGTITTTFGPGDGDITVLVAELRRLLAAAGISEIRIRADADTVALVA